jgi:TRAP-type C4-dicarboxylate transport system permease small subunit
MEKLKVFGSEAISFFYNKVIVYAGYFSGYCIYGMMFLICYMVFVRRVLNSPMANGDEILIYFVVAVVSLGVAYTLKEKAHIEVTLLLTRLSSRIREPWLRITNIIVFPFLVVFSLMCWDVLLDSYHTGKTSMTAMLTPLYLPQSIIALGFTTLCVASGLQIYFTFKSNKGREGRRGSQNG